MKNTIRNARLKQKISQRQLARTLGISSAAVCNWEAGTRGIHPLRVAAVEAALGLEAGALSKKPSTQSAEGQENHTAGEPPRAQRRTYNA